MGATSRLSPPSGYHRLAEFYPFLFPVPEPLKKNLKPSVRSCVSSQKPWLDVGCGTGELVLWLRDQGVESFGIDPDQEFLNEGIKRVDADGVFACGTLSDWGKHSDRNWGAITCLGNVLAHADGIKEIEQFLGLAKERLCAGAVLTIQTVNFDRVLDRADWTFPPLRKIGPGGMDLSFHRCYEPRGNRLLFHTRLSGSGFDLENEVSLFPVRAKELRECLERRFERVDLMGDFRGGAWSTDAPATVFEVC